MNRLCALLLLLAALTAAAAEPFFIGVGHLDGQGSDGKKIEAQFGVIVVSADGEKWESVFKGGPVTEGFNHAKNNLIRCLTYGNGLFVASGNSGIFHSKDGRKWELSSAPHGSMTVAYGNDRFVAPSAYENLISKDGITWTKAVPKMDSPAFGKDGAGHIRKVVFGNGVFVCTGEQRISVTKDGETWLHHETLLGEKLPGQQSLLAFGAGRFVWYREKLPTVHSTDGIKWEPVEFPAGAKGNDLLWTGAEFLMSGNDAIYASADGIKWTQRPGKGYLRFHCAGKNLLLQNNSWGKQVIRATPDFGATWRDGKVESLVRQLYFFDGKDIIGQSGG